MNIGDRIRLRREELGYTQDEVAKKLGYKHRSSVQKIECSREVPMKKIQRFADALETTVPYLMGWENDLIIEVANLDVELSNMDKRIKEYALKLNELPKEKQDQIISLIDMIA